MNGRSLRRWPTRAGRMILREMLVRPEVIDSHVNPPREPAIHARGVPRPHYLSRRSDESLHGLNSPEITTLAF